MYGSKSPKFTKRHYQEFAEMLREHKANPELVEAMKQKFRADNPRFDSDRFDEAVKGEYYRGMPKQLQEQRGVHPPSYRAKKKPHEVNVMVASEVGKVNESGHDM
jgi:hypothetical protein